MHKLYDIAVLSAQKVEYLAQSLVIEQIYFKYY